MRKSLSLVCLAFASVATFFADAHQLRAQFPGAGPQLTDPDSFRRVASDLSVGLPGRFWVESNVADEGLGYSGTYFTVGAKNRLFQDSFDGRWLGEARFHHSVEDDGGFFANVGIERVFSIESAKADIVTGFWYDFDGDAQGTFANDFSQVGISAAIKTKKWDLIGNGYFPVGITDRTTAGADGNNVFFGNNILLTPGVDSALQGFDVTLRMRPELLGFGNGIIDIGGYGYSSDLVNSFGGGRVRLGFQTQRGVQITAEVNHDDRFDTTGVLSIGYVFGGQGARGDAGVGLARDLEETVRNDHIVRFNSQPVLAIDPDTGLAFNVVHVNNTADPSFGEGTFDRPFASLAAAEANSAPGDVIYIGQGDGSLNGLNTGIALQDNQRLFGAGGDIFIPIQDNQLFLLPGTGPRSTIANPGGFSVVSLADNNQVRNVNIDATGAQQGIYGNGSNGGEISDVNVTGASQNGVLLENISGDWVAARASFSNNINDGFSVRGNPDPTSTFLFDNVTLNGNGSDGLHLEDYESNLVTIQNSTTNGNGRHGVFLGNHTGNNLDLDFLGHTASNNGANGIFVNGGRGDLNILNATVTNNAVSGIRIENFGNGIDGSTFIGNADGGTSTITGNGINNLELILNQGNIVQDVLITGLTISDGGRGVSSTVNNPGSVMNLAIVDNFEISRHLTDGIRLTADQSGVLNVLIENEDPTAPLLLNDNAQTGAAGIALFADGPVGQDNSQINAIIRNVSINNDLESGFATTILNVANQTGLNIVGNGASQINLQLEDSRIESALAVNAAFDNDGNGAINNVFADNLVIRGDSGILLNSLGGTRLDFSVSNSDIQSNGLITAGFQQDANDFAETGAAFTDVQGDFGFAANVVGDIGGGLDNLTRIQFSNNLVRDFTFDAVQVTANGDAQVLAYIIANQILQNGPGNDNLIEFPDNPATAAGDSGVAPVNPAELGFHHGIVVNARGTSRVSARIESNQLLNNFELGIQLNASGNATLNASLVSNSLANDIGQDADGLGAGVITTLNSDLQVNSSGNASVCLHLSENAIRSLNLMGPQLGEGDLFNLGNSFSPLSTQPLTVEADGATNGFTDAALAGLGLVTGTVGVCEGLISDEELFFAANGFVDANTPPGGGFQP